MLAVGKDAFLESLNVELAQLKSPNLGTPYCILLNALEFLLLCSSISFEVLEIFSPLEDSDSALKELFSQPLRLDETEFSVLFLFLFFGGFSSPSGDLFRRSGAFCVDPAILVRSH